MNFITAGAKDLSNPVARRWSRIVVPLFLCLASADVLAQSEDSSTALAPLNYGSLDERSRPQLEVSASSFPRFDNLDSAYRASRMDMTLLPQRRSALGLAVGVTSTEGLAPFAGGPVTSGPTSVDLGVHWRYTLDSNYRFDVTAWRRLATPEAVSLIQSREPSYGARVEMRITPSQTGLVAERRFLGFQLESGARIGIRRAHGKPMVYYRTKF